MVGKDDHFAKKKCMKNEKVQIVELGFCWCPYVEFNTKIIRDRGFLLPYYQKLLSQAIQR